MLNWGRLSDFDCFVKSYLIPESEDSSRQELEAYNFQNFSNGVSNAHFQVTEKLES